MASDAAPLVVIVGPTAAGKSALAESLALTFGAELVSADALQLYRGLDVGTAKPTAQVRARIPHHCVDVLPATGRCSAGEYAVLAREALEDIRRRDRMPVLVGGSGFYIRAALSGLDRLPRSDPAWRKALEIMLHRHGPEHLHRMLTALDPDWAGQLAARDRQRCLRALEVVLRTGRRRRQLVRAGRDSPPAPGRTLWFGVTLPRAELRSRIERRVDRMLAAGWTVEVESLLGAGVPVDAHALQAIGYRDLVDHVSGAVPLSVARERIINGTRKYAKRQLTWFRRLPQVKWWQLGEAPDGVSFEQARAEIETEIRASSGC